MLESEQRRWLEGVYRSLQELLNDPSGVRRGLKKFARARGIDDELIEKFLNEVGLAAADD